MKLYIRAISLILALAMCFTLLSGCADSRDKTVEVQQMALPDDMVDNTMREIEYSALMSGFLYNDGKKLFEYSEYSAGAVVCDVDKDNIVDLLYGVHFLRNADKMTYNNMQALNTFDWYIDKDGNYYYCYYGAEPSQDVQNEWLVYATYISYSGEEEKIVFDKHVYGVQEYNIVYDDAGNVIDKTPGDFINLEEDCKIGDRAVSEAEFDQYIEELELKTVEFLPANEVTVNCYDVCFADSITQSVYDYLNNVYGCQMIESDIDYDGQYETVYFISNIFNEWSENTDGYFYDERVNTTIIIADRDYESIAFSVYSFANSYSSSVNISYQNGYLRVGDSFIIANGKSLLYNSNISNTSQINEFSSYIRSYGYKNPVYKWVDIADSNGDELLCICQDGENQWVIIIICFVNGTPTPVYMKDINASACYLVDVDGKTHICTYYQNIDNSGDRVYNSYGYDVFRFDKSMKKISADSSSVSYYSDTQNAGETAAFFEAFNKYVVKLIVIYDPYGITGSYWINQNDVDSGSLPSSEQNENTQNEQTGYVNIDDGDTWLNLRVAPGISYDKVLLNPNDPESFVRQAKGAPVTVLETVDTTDPTDTENPVWVKIRIIYSGHELIGYSSKNFITLYND